MTTWKRRGLYAGAAAVGAALLGFLVAASGVIPIAASSGHWDITAWMLKFSMRRSVATHALGVDAPDDLHEPGRVLRGAGHYASGCAFCHGEPGEPMPPVPAAMTPHPPNLVAPVAKLDDEELFYVVRHGVKFTGMPAWPAPSREDEVWAVVAFLRQLPDLTASEYQELVHPEDVATAEVPDVVTRTCTRCHGADGLGRLEGAFPRLAGQDVDYLVASLQAYRGMSRHSGIMQPIAVRLSSEEIAEASQYYSALPPMGADAPPSDEESLGARIATEGIPEQNLPRCAGCHGGNRGESDTPYPVLAGQQAHYLRNQLELFRAGRRGGTQYAHIMREVADHGLTDEQIHAVAHYYASLRSDP